MKAVAAMRITAPPEDVSLLLIDFSPSSTSKA